MATDRPNVISAPAADNIRSVKRRKATELISSTIRASQFSYVKLYQSNNSSDQPELDELQVRSYLDAALTRFLGLTGAGMSIDLLEVKGQECWLRVPHDDLGAFSAAVASFPGLQQNVDRILLSITACGDWLGSLVGQERQADLWKS
jgi:ribonuclease P/MRP protein subunit POP8